MMTLRERILTVYRGETPDVVPFMLDLSHWFYHRHHLPWDLSVAHTEVETDLLDCHRAAGAGFYLNNLSAFWECAYRPEVTVETERTDGAGAPRITWRFHTPIGTIARTRVWEEQTYAWGMADWGVRSEADLRVLAYAMDGRRFTPRWDNYAAWVRAVGDLGVVYMPTGYSGMGQLLNYWMGVEGVMYAACDWPGAVRATVDTINAGNLDLVNLLCASPAEIIIMGDNFSSDIQPPHFFAAWSQPYYTEAIRRLHAAGKQVAVHIDGRLRGALAMLRDCGADAADAVTPTPMGDLDPAACRDEAGPDFILSGGVAPNLWLPETPVAAFDAKVREWLELRRRGPRLIAAAGDQVPPGADEKRIARMRNLVEKYGTY